MAWVKLHDDILGDPKLMRAARVGGAELVLLPWLLAFASKAADNGRLSVGAAPAEPEDVAYQIPGVTAAQVEAAQRALVAIGVLSADDDGCLRFSKWEDRQAKPSDSKTAWRERKQKSRAKKRGHATGAGQGVTGGRDDGEGESKTGGVTPRHATDKKRGEEKRGEAEKSVPLVAGAPNGADGDPAEPSPLPKAICDLAYETWISRMGPIKYGWFRKLLLPVYESKFANHPTGEQLVNAVEAFVEARQADAPQFRKTYTLTVFTGALHEYVRLGGMPLVDEWGEPTERGRAAGVGAAA